MTDWSPYMWLGHLVIGVPLGLLYENWGEWFIHKRVLHDMGRNKKSFWAFHWHEHHGSSRKNGFVDPHYQRSLWSWTSQSKEALLLVVGALAHLPLVSIAPGFVIGLYFAMLRYYVMHKRSHLDPEWARAKLPWHYDHHMGPNQDSNWCVTKPWFDDFMGTREVYVGTERELRDRKRRSDREEKRRAVTISGTLSLTEDGATEDAA